MAHPGAQRMFWRVVRRLFRWFRFSVWLLLLSAILSAIWLNRIGLPDFLKNRLVAELRSRGFDLQFSRMRLHWFRGFVAEDVKLGRPADTNAPQVSAQQAELLIDGRALLDRRLTVSGVALRGGHVSFPVWGTNDTPREVLLKKVNGEIRFLPRDTWELAGFRAAAFGVDIRLGGTVSNATAIKNLKFARKQGPQKTKTAEAFWYDFMARLEQSTFEEPATILGSIYGDAADPSSFRASLNVSSPAVNSPWGRGRNVSASVQLAPSASGAFYADVKLQADDAVTQWGEAKSLSLDGDVAPSFTRWTPTNAHLSITVRSARTQWAAAGNLSLIAEFSPSPSDPNASLVRYTLRGQRIDTDWGRAAQLELDSDAVLSSSNLWPSAATARLRFGAGEGFGGRAAAGSVQARLDLPPIEQMRFAETNVSWWRRAEIVKAGLEVDLTHLQAGGGEVKQLQFTADWRNPALSLRNVRASLYDGSITGSAELNTDTRRLSAAAKTTVDPHKMNWLLDTNTQKFLADLAWQSPPLISAAGEVVLPAWTNGAVPWKQVDWDKEVLPALAVRGDFEVGEGAFRSIPMSGARSSFTFSNFIWRLPDLVLTRPEGRAVVAHTGHSRTHEFTFDIDSTINPLVVAPLLSQDEREILNEFSFTNMPRARIQLAGHSRDPKKTSFHADVAVTNLSFRGLPVREARSIITLTNQVLTCIHPVVVRSEGTGRADAVRIDIPRDKIYIENATGRLDPAAVTHAIGSEVEETMRPYRFVEPPEGRVNGVIDIDDVERSDLMFELAGGPFEWMWFRFQQITGRVHWAGSTVMISNVIGTLNGGRLEGGVRLDFPEKGCVFSFRTVFNNINLNSLIADLGNTNSKAEGSLNGVLTITNANSEITNSWNGFGNLAVNDGLLWDFPVFGIFSPVLNAIKPGAGNSRAKDAVATFVVSNNVIHSSDLLVHASGMRLKLEGTVDFEKRVNATMAAQLLRDTPGIGWIFSTVFSPISWLFEYRVTGTLAKPSAYPKRGIIGVPIRGFQKLMDLGVPRDQQETEAPKPPAE